MLRLAFPRRLATIALVALAASCVFWVVAASADAPDVNTPTLYPNGNQTQLVSVVDNGNQTTTVTIKGGWSWPTHTTDCNTDRAGAGYAIDWSDPNDTGFLLANLNSTDIFVGSTGSNGLNPYDQAVHVTPNDTGATAINDINDPANWASWRSGCGKYQAGTYVDKNGTHNATFSQGTWGPISHTYSTPNGPSDLAGLQICAVTYDVHPGTKASANGGAGIPSKESEVVAAGTIGSGKGAVGHNKDNSVESNSKTPAGNACAGINLSALTTTASADTQGPASIFDTAHLSGVSAHAHGTITFHLYSNDQCNAEVAGSPVTNSLSIDGPGDYASTAIPVGPSSTTTYYWRASYSGDGPNSPVALTGCKAAGEDTTVTPPPPPPPDKGNLTVAKIWQGVSGTTTLQIGTAANGHDIKSGQITGNDQISSDVDPGNYFVSETGGLAGYASSDPVCKDGDTTVTLNQDGSVPVASDQNVVCTITNTSQGTIRLKKVWVGATGTTTLTIDGPGGTFTSGSDTGAQTVQTGTYTVGESNVPGYTSALDCKNGQTDLGSSTTVDLGLGDNVVCTYTNTQDATIIVKEVTVGGDATFDFTGDLNASLSNGGTQSAQVPANQTYTTTQTQLSGWTLTSIDCTTDGSHSGTTATYNPGAGETVTCTFTNTKNSTPPPPPTTTSSTPTIDLAITKSASPNPATVGSQITWTMVVTNNGPSDATGVTVSDPLPSETTFVSASSTQGSCSNSSGTVTCSIGNMADGAKVTVTIVTTLNAVGNLVNTATVKGNQTETNTANNAASAPDVAQAAFVPPKVKPPAIVCSSIVATPKLLYVGRAGTLTLHVTKKGQAAKGVRIQIKGAGLNVKTGASNAKGVIKVHVKPGKAGIVRFTPVAPQKACKAARIGVTGVFTPPVTG